MAHPIIATHCWGITWTSWTQSGRLVADFSPGLHGQSMQGVQLQADPRGEQRILLH